MNRLKVWSIKALLSAFAMSILAWPTWVTRSLSEIRTDVALIKQAVAQIAAHTIKEPKPTIPQRRKKATPSDYANRDFD